MKASALKYSVLTWASSLVTIMIVLMPFHAFLTVWGASLIGHYMALRLWKEVLLLICGVAVLFLLITDHKIRTHTLSRRLVWLICLYAVITLVWGLVAYRRNMVTGEALGYGLISNLRFLLFFLVTWALSLRLERMHGRWQWMTLWPATVVIAIGILQFIVLPNNFLAHFGYGPNTISPFETINHNSHYIRIASTLRGANPLGAYLIVPLSMLSVLLLQRRIDRKQSVLLGAALLCLFFSFSRSAWLGALIALGIVIFLCVQSLRTRKIIAASAMALVLVCGVGFALLRTNDMVENYVFHTQAESTIKQSSNQGHVSALSNGAEDVLHHPLGTGTGTAGPASVYNGTCGARISENYFLQIGQETGWLGLAVFLLINIGVGYLLWLRRTEPLALSLFAALIGITVVNLLSHAWADDTLAYLWWGLAGIAMAPNLKALKQQSDAKS